jgi:hypothetical protein
MRWAGAEHSLVNHKFAPIDDECSGDALQINFTETWTEACLNVKTKACGFAKYAG